MAEQYSEVFLYSDYQKLVDKYMDKDCRELNFQNRVIMPFLEKLLIRQENIWIVDVSTQYRNRDSKYHDTKKYRSSDKNAAPPDLLIAHDWDYHNRDNKNIKLLAVVEVKSPSMTASRIWDKEDTAQYHPHTLTEVEHHLAVNPKVILTDCIKWVFIEKNDTTKVQTFNLYTEKGQWKTNDVQNKDTPNEWSQLCKYISSFLFSSE